MLFPNRRTFQQRVALVRPVASFSLWYLLMAFTSSLVPLAQKLEYRDPRGIRFPMTLLLLGIVLANMAGFEDQVGMAQWLEANWERVLTVWRGATGNRINDFGAPSQPTLSRLFARLDDSELRIQLGAIQQALLAAQSGMPLWQVLESSLDRTLASPFALGSKELSTLKDQILWLCMMILSPLSTDEADRTLMIRRLGPVLISLTHKVNLGAIMSSQDRILVQDLVRALKDCSGLAWGELVVLPFSVDGKARKGVVSPTTGRTECTVSIFSSSTNEVVGSIDLADKEGEVTGTVKLLGSLAPLPGAIFTLDAGLTSPAVLQGIKMLATLPGHRQHGYLAALKGNSGNVYEIVEVCDWAGVKTSHTTHDTTNDHGREETRTVKKISINTLDPLFQAEFEKYSDATIIVQVTRTSVNVKSRETSKDVAYYVGDSEAARQSLSSLNARIRGHWAIESFHWCKDKVQNEDLCHIKKPRQSRIMGSIRNEVFRIGRTMSHSLKQFLRTFSIDCGTFLPLFEA